MAKRMVRYFTNGLITIVPIGLVIYVVYNVFLFLDGLLGNYIRRDIPGDYVPGFGLLVTLVLITLVGWLTTKVIARRLFDFADRLLMRIPLVKSLYSIIRETVHSLVGEKRSFSQVVLVDLPEMRMQLIGFLTSESVHQFGPSVEDSVAVYFPFSFQISGYTALVPRDAIRRVDMSVEEAMKFALSAGVTGRSQE